jgi:hypothetical protein
MACLKQTLRPTAAGSVRIALLFVCLLLVAPASAQRYLWDGNAHYYEFVSGAVPWTAADAEAKLRGGYLATITSAAENAFILEKFGTGSANEFAWVGGVELRDDDVWTWFAGPEAGRQFSMRSTPTPPDDYANWGGVEPNDNKPFEDFLMFNIGATLAGIAPGQWADASPTPSSADPVKGYIVEYGGIEVNFVEIAAIDSDLDVNPNAGGGMRIFPCQQTPTDAIDRRKVKVRALTSFPAGTIIYFRSFDVDDPSSDEAPVDPNGASGGDNRGIPRAGTLSAASTITDANGVAEVEFMVTMQPGDNFQVVASPDQAYLNGIVENGGVLRDSEGATIPTALAQTSVMLTVWRRVHIEVDSMGLVRGNRETPSVLKAHYKQNRNATDLQLDMSLPEARLELGRVWNPLVGSFLIQSNKGKHVEVHRDARALEGKAVFVVDDDDFNDDDPPALPDGDQFEDVTSPDTSLIQDSDDWTKNVFAPAYVRPTYGIIGDNNSAVAFVLNLEGDLTAAYDFDQVATEASTTFWTVYLLGAYQPGEGEDADPDTEEVTVGEADRINGEGASVFNEALREGADRRVDHAAVTAHEIGHLFWGIHWHGELMAPSLTQASITFAPATLNTIRSLDHP